MTKDRLLIESAFHDHQARQRRSTFLDRPDQLRFSDDDYLDHETWVRPAFERLGVLQNLRALDFGCGHGMAAIVLARHGAQVTALDSSYGYLAEARQRALANNTEIQFVQATGERLPFVDGSFDRIWGNAILHHLDVRAAGRKPANGAQTRFPAKAGPGPDPGWRPVGVKKTRHIKNPEPRSDAIGTEKARGRRER